MGTRADFYVGMGKQAEWLGSIAWDGYPDGKPKAVLGAASEMDWRARVSALLASEKSGTVPDDGWPWPWEDSGLTDYAYAFTPDGVAASCFGGPWFDPTKPEPEYKESPDGKKLDWPDMTSRQRVAMGKRSGTIIIGRA